uniref:CCHC-type domain-containing protein n=1 Tax=Caenorhabditis japonica TaxID=281687 RepID=A0A8R1EUL6_CAEJA
MSNQEEANESASSAPPIFTAEQVALFKSQLIELCRPDLQAMARRTEGKSARTLPKGTPRALRTVEKLEAISALAGGTTATDSARMLAMMTQLAAEDNQKPRYRQPNGHQWFRAAGSFQGPERVRDNYGFNTQKRTGGPRSQSVEQSYGKSPQRCFNCHRTGHFAAHCKQRNDLREAGVCVAEDKSCWTPSERFTWLGVEGDLVARNVRLTEKREHSLRMQLERMRKSLAPSILDRQKLCGYLSSMMIVAGETAIARQRNTSSMVAQAQRAGASEKAEVELSEEGPKKAFFDRITQVAMSPELCNLAALLAQSALLAKAPNTLKAYQAENRLRKAWMAKKDLPEEEQSLLLYLAHRSQVVGSGSIAKAIAAFRMVNNNLSIFGGQLAGDLIKSMKKREIESRTQPSQISWTEVEKIVKRVDVQDPKSERNALITLIS